MEEERYILGIDWAVDSPQYKLIQEGAAAERARIRKGVKNYDDTWTAMIAGTKYMPVTAVLDIINEAEKE